MIDEIRFLGKEVIVQVDRPLQSAHPEFGFEYLLNYGFVPGTTGGDQEEIDAYILGVEQPIAQFSGVVKAIIVRLNDVENKLVVSKEAYPLTKQEILDKTFFQEQFFDIEIILQD